jgi:hypothetical protein
MAVADSAPWIIRLGAQRRRAAIGGGVAVVATALVAILAWAAFHHPATSPPATAAAAGVSGVVVIEGGPLPGVRAVRWAPLVVEGTTAAGPRLMRHRMTDGKGRFTLRLPPGRYTVTAVIFGGEALGSQPHSKVLVTRGQPVRVRITGYVN